MFLRTLYGPNVGCSMWDFRVWGYISVDSIDIL